MKHLSKSILSLIALPLLCCFSLSSCTGGGYYDRAEGKTGSALKNALHDITTPSGRYYDYNSLANQYETSDNVEGKDGYVRLFYSSKEYNWPMWGMYGTDDNSVQREHVWPQSRFKIYGVNDDSKLNPYNDVHNVRPAWGSDNAKHSNLFYGEGSTNLFDPDTLKNHDKINSYRGDIARIIFYMAVRYDKLEIVDRNTAGTDMSSYEIGRLSYLLKWNLENPVSPREIQRNEAIYKGRQGNKNPFIDHPEYACKIWGETNEETKGICNL